MGLGTGPGSSGNCKPALDWLGIGKLQASRHIKVPEATVGEQLPFALCLNFRLVIILALSSSDFVSIVAPRAAFRSQMLDGTGWW